MAERFIKLFGEPDVTLDGEKVELGAALPLLAVLILWRERSSAGLNDLIAELHKDTLSPDSETQDPASCLRKRKKVLRQALKLELPNNLKPSENAPAILSQAWVDVVEFDEKIGSADSQQVREAIELRQRGPLLANWQEPASIGQERTSRERKYQAALWRLIQQERLTHPQEAIRHVDVLLGVEDLPDKRIEILEELRLELEHAITRQVKALRVESDTAITPANGLIPPCRLPYTAIDVIGRESEGASVKDLLRKPGLVTLTGPAGVGKSRFACALVSDLHENFQGRIAFSDLSSVTNAAQLAQTVGASLGLAEEERANQELTEDTGHSWPNRLVSFLRDKCVLIVWDNCEHLVNHCADLAALLVQCPSVHLVTTSREALRVYGERAFQVPALPVESAAELFAARAQSVFSGFRLTERNSATVVKICQDLDGLPLAIELAASLVDYKSLQQIADSLRAGLKVLGDGPRAGSLRHPTLQAAFDLSYHLLNPAEQQLFRCLGIFAGSFSLEAAEAVAGPSLAHLLPQLVRKSLVVADEHDDEMRFRLLVTVRQYAQGHLQERGEWDEACRKHRAHYLNLAEEAEPGLKGPDPKPWLDRLEMEIGNLRAALEWRADEDALGLACALQRFWQMRGYFQEGRQWLERHVQAPDAVPEAIRAAASAGAGDLANLQGKFREARDLYETSLNLWLNLGDEHRAAAALCALGDTAIFQANYVEAGIKYQESQQLYTKAGFSDGLSDVLYGFAKIEHNRTHFLEAREKLEACLALRRLEGDAFKIGEVAMTLGRVLVYQGQHQEARVLLEECLALQRQIGDMRRTATALISFGEWARIQGKDGEAKAYYEESLALVQQVGDRWSSAMCLSSLGLIAYDLKQFEEARQKWEQSLLLLEEMGNERAAVGVLANLATVAHDLGDGEGSRKLLQESLSKNWALGERAWVACIIEELGLLAAEMDHNRRAATLLGAAKGFLEETQYPQTPNDRNRSSQAASETLEALGEEAFTMAWAEGQAMTWEQAVAFALEEPAL